MSVPSIVVDKVCFEYFRTRALVDVTFALPRGSVTALLGPNGSGKTTLLHLLAGLYQPLSGSLQIAGNDPTFDPKSVHASVGFLPDRIGLFSDMTARQALEYCARLHGLKGNIRRKRIEQLMHEFNLGALENKLPTQMSRGQQQRLAIVQSLVHEPQILLLDEPMANLDPGARVEMATIIRALATSGVTMVVSSHILSELKDYATSILVLKEGRVVEQGSLVEHASDNENQERKTLLTFSLVQSVESLDAFEQVGFSDLEVNGLHIRCSFFGSDRQRAIAIVKITQAGILFKEVRTESNNIETRYLESLHRSP